MLTFAGDDHAAHFGVGFGYVECLNTSRKNFGSHSVAHAGVGKGQHHGSAMAGAFKLCCHRVTLMGLQMFQVLHAKVTSQLHLDASTKGLGGSGGRHTRFAC